MYKIVFIGAGNISWSLIPAMQKVGCEVKQVISRDKAKLKKFVSAYKIENFGTNVDQIIEDAELIFLTVPDESIETITKKLPSRESILVHTSGSIPLKSLSAWNNKIGVFYPMQTFTQQKQVDMKEVPIFVEGHSEEIKDKLFRLGQDISAKVYEMNSQDRLRLHLGAVIASNFSNYLYQLINHVVPSQEELDFSIYEGLIREQLEKALTFGPENVQTGPAIRGDLVTVNKHLKLLEQHPNLRNLYVEISRMINKDIFF